MASAVSLSTFFLSYAHVLPQTRHLSVVLAVDMRNLAFLRLAGLSWFRAKRKIRRSTCWSSPILTVTSVTCFTPSFSAISVAVFMTASANAHSCIEKPCVLRKLNILQRQSHSIRMLCGLCLIHLKWGCSKTTSESYGLRCFVAVPSVGQFWESAPCNLQTRAYLEPNSGSLQGPIEGGDRVRSESNKALSGKVTLDKNHLISMLKSRLELYASNLHKGRIEKKSEQTL
jgi:hypothetical protein